MGRPKGSKNDSTSTLPTRPEAATAPKEKPRKLTKDELLSCRDKHNLYIWTYGII